MKLFIEGATGEQLAKRMLKLAWNACGGPVGMGVLQDRGPDVTEDQIWERAARHGDYVPKAPTHGKVDADYVFGRMMKLYFAYNDDFIEVRDGETWRSDYQSFCRRYPDFETLANAAAKTLDANVMAPSPQAAAPASETTPR